MILTINNDEYAGIRTREELMDTLQAYDEPNAEIWLRLNGDHDGDLPQLCLLKNGPLCCVQYMTTSNGFYRYYSYDTNWTGMVKKVQFALANGEYYDTYSSNCIALEQGHVVMIDFLETNGQKSTWIDWQRQ